MTATFNASAAAVGAAAIWDVAGPRAWFASLPGNQMGRLANALDELNLN